MQAGIQVLLLLTILSVVCVVANDKRKQPHLWQVAYSLTSKHMYKAHVTHDCADGALVVYIKFSF